MSHPIPASMRSMGQVAQAYTAWKIKKKIAVKIKGPATLWVSTRSMRALMLRLVGGFCLRVVVAISRT